MNLQLSELPRKAGLPDGKYRFRYSELSVKLPGCHLVNGVSVEPVTGRALVRVRGAYGPQSVIEPWDEETALAVVDHLESRNMTERASQLMAEFADADFGLIEERRVANEAEEAEAEAERAAEAERLRAEHKAADEAHRAKQAEDRLAADAARREVEEAETAPVPTLQDAMTPAPGAPALPPVASPQLPGIEPSAASDTASDGQAEAVPPAEPVIDDDVDTIEDPDVLVAMAAGLGLETEDVPLPELRLNIRNARKDGGE